MPRRILFEGHPEVGWLHDHYLFGMPVLPRDLLYEHSVLEKQYDDNIVPLSRKESRRLDEFHATKKPLVMWMHDLVKEVEGECRHEPFSWKFLWHIRTYHCDEESENVSVSSPPYWYVTIEDFEGTCVHKNWTIAFDATFGDLRIIRGTPSHENPFWKAPWRERSTWLGRVLDAIHEHQRIRNFRLRRTGVEIPV